MYQDVLEIKNLPVNAGDGRDASSIPGWEDSLEEHMATNSRILIWRTSMDREAWWATVHGVARGWT